MWTDPEKEVFKEKFLQGGNSIDILRLFWGIFGAVTISAKAIHSYRVTHFVYSNLALTSKQKFRFGRSG